MYEPQPGETKLQMRTSPGLTAALVITAILTIWLGVKPGDVLNYATRGAGKLLQPTAQQSSELRR
jgi:hypothetical protein